MTKSASQSVIEVEVKEVFNSLASQKDATLIDVRTVAEWSYVGFVDLSGIGKTPIFLEWQMFPHNQVDPLFVEKLTAECEKRNISKEANLFFLCRSGVRSLAAANALSAAGYKHCINVKDGFEGPLDADQRRGKLSGWKAEGLPWVQR